MRCANSVEPAKLDCTGVSSDFGFDGKGDLKQTPVTILKVNGGNWDMQSVVL
ncbi:hypothetical protein OL229_08420 [Neisseriaceae bacterium JH1-16]|nr:hypothetical protein [Neisseriaceae bacterium JH1-16]